MLYVFKNDMKNELNSMRNTFNTCRSQKHVCVADGDKGAMFLDRVKKCIIGQDFWRKLANIPDIYLAVDLVVTAMA